MDKPVHIFYKKLCKGKRMRMDINMYKGRQKRYTRIRTGTAALLVITMILGSWKIVKGTEDLNGKILLTSAALSMPQGISAMLESRFHTEEREKEGAVLSDGQEEIYGEYELGGIYEGESEREERDTEKEKTPEVNEEEKEVTAEQPVIAAKNQGKVLQKQYTASVGGIYIGYGNGIIKNSTSLTRERVESELSKAGWFEEIDVSSFSEEQPLVLIVHTHATESYERYNTGIYDKSYTFRSTDNTENMVAVGEVLAETLEGKGIPVVQAAVQHDNPSYNGSYNRSAETVRKYLEMYPSIRFVLDVHRDAIEPEKGRIIKAVAEIEGKTAAQVMIISGCDDGTMNMPNYFDNLRFAAALQDKMEGMFPGLTRPVFFCYRKYNMDLSKGALLIEVGSHGNTLSEAKYSAELIGRALAALLIPESVGEEKNENKEAEQTTEYRELAFEKRRKRSDDST
ncbi:MAG: hypothetical protein E7487_10390 [Ruminococcaceae bacterium]|nr:hypothetical protein [Oscillospiraceae bacterium]